MVFKKIAVSALCASALAMVSVPASAAAYLIGGKWYYFSLDYDATLKKVTGKELKSGLQVKSDATVLESQIQCGNPQGSLINPGQGPQLSVGTVSDPLSEANVDKSDRSKSTFLKTVKVQLPPDGVNTCESPANSPNGEWKPLYWKKDGCARGDEIGESCYSAYAYKKADGSMYYVSGPLDGQQISDTGNWTFVYLPTKFGYVSTVLVGGEPTVGVKGTCSFAANPLNGEPYSLTNPPFGGWAKVKTPYVCDEYPVP